MKLGLEILLAEYETMKQETPKKRRLKVEEDKSVLFVELTKKELKWIVLVIIIMLEWISCICSLPQHSCTSKFIVGCD